MNDVAVLGLGVMGANLARNFASRGFKVSGYDQSSSAAQRLAAAHPEAELDAAGSLGELVAKLEKPRRIIVLVPAGPAVDAVLDALDSLLEQDDVVIDAGNSHYRDTDRRAARSASRPWRFVGMGVSGGSEGALRGPSMMPGGDPLAWERLRPLLEPVAAVAATGPCVTYCGRGSAGHFVKTVHNGIEYGDMQLIAETASVLRSGLGLGPSAVADAFARWNAGELSSYLVEITSDIFRFEDPERPGALLLDSILDSAGQKGTGRWVVAAALELGVAVPTIAAAVDARVMSSEVELRRNAEATLAADAEALRGRLEGLEHDDLRAALYAAKLASYTQGFALLAAASRAYGYGTDLSEVARIWTAGCIIRARILDRIRQELVSEREHGRHTLIALRPGFAEELRRAAPGLRRVVSAAARCGYAIPGLAASLAWFETLTTGRGSAALIQAQRDYFGSHTYERVDRAGAAVHTEWKAG